MTVSTVGVVLQPVPAEMPRANDASMRLLMGNRMAYPRRIGTTPRYSVRLSEPPLHREVRTALERSLTCKSFLVGFWAWRLHGPPAPEDVDHLARRLDAWLSSLDPDTDDATTLHTELQAATVGVAVHAIPKDERDCDRRARPIVWHDEPLSTSVA